MRRRKKNSSKETEETPQEDTRVLILQEVSERRVLGAGLRGGGRGSGVVKVEEESSGFCYSAR